MGDVARDGRTVLFVSHSMAAVQRLCTRGIALKHGQVAADGSTDEVIAWYVGDATAQHGGDGWLDVRNQRRDGGSGEVRVVGVACESDYEPAGRQPYSEGPLTVRLLLEAETARPLGSVAVTLYDQLGTKLVNADSVKLGTRLSVSRGLTVASFEIVALHLMPGSYMLGWWVADPGDAILDFVERGLQIEILDPPATGATTRPASDGAVTCEFVVQTGPESSA